jgi:hypothetical protein
MQKKTPTTKKNPKEEEIAEELDFGDNGILNTT